MSGSSDSVLKELLKYQNDDGGFGNALEPDLRTPGSSALATSVGLRILKEINCHSGDSAVSRTVKYLVESYNESIDAWRIVPDDVNQHPHAPWWHDEGDSLEKTFGGFQLNPKAEIIGLLNHYSNLVPTEWLVKLTEFTASYIESNEYDWIELMNVIRMIETDSLPKTIKERLLPKVAKTIDKLVCRESAEWGGHSSQPINLITSPNSPFYDNFKTEINENLDFIISSQSEDGTWIPNWSWFNMYPESWKIAKIEWIGELTLRNLITLQNFNRIENINSKDS